jgi:uncharacterized protein YbcC (UPF0753/DUF2309 family)
LTPSTTLESVESHQPRPNTQYDLVHAIEHAAHLLPAQGPITAFVHHNTLHAFEDMSFEQAVLQGAQTFGCQPYLSEARYREIFSQGRFTKEDLEEVLMDDLGDRADDLLGFMGTRFHLRRAILAYPLLISHGAELRWAMTESDSLRCFREEAPRSIRDHMIVDTRQWILRDVSNLPVGAELAIRSRGVRTELLQDSDACPSENWDTAAWEAFTLKALWQVCRRGVQQAKIPQAEPTTGNRHRDLLLEVTQADSDEWVHSILIPLTAAFIDQGFADWELPHRDEGYFEAFLHLFRRSSWLEGRKNRLLAREALRVKSSNISALDSIRESLEILGVSAKGVDSFLSQTLLALRGFAGMIWQLETRSDRAVRGLPAGSLTEFLAVRLILDRISVAETARAELGFRGSLADLTSELQRPRRQSLEQRDEQVAYQIFQLAQLIGWCPRFMSTLNSSEWSQLVREMEEFSSEHRRSIYHMAYERRYRHQTLDAVAEHSYWLKTQKDAAHGADAGATATDSTFQIVCCIDEREESFRRHLEEVDKRCRTFGAAGFFGVAMYYKGAADAHYTPLCPVIITPQHYVNEIVDFGHELADRRRRNRRRTLGTFTHRFHTGSRTIAGGILAAVLGSLASLPLVMRILFPRGTAQLRSFFGAVVTPPAVTHLRLEKTAPPEGEGPRQMGYDVDEMAAIVERLLRDIGLTTDFMRLVVICGHGSSSMNNPHESAHDCGACAGGRGGPNARAFAQMANHPRVRERVAAGGVCIPEETIFVGAYHNTCDDHVTYFDLDQVPSTHTSDISHARQAIDEARQRSAHERCRRFESFDLGLGTAAALKHVEGRAEDLSQVRPEYGHATNALCFVGRRAWSRGLFLDRRAFLQSYDPSQDDADATILTRILQAVIPVCAGINLEYYFSYVDPRGYGCGTKLPHNVTSLLGVMDGAISDLRTGLPWQMVEIHEPVRLLFVIETTPEKMLRIMAANPGIDRLVRGGWVQVAVFNAETSSLHQFHRGEFQGYSPSRLPLPEVTSSQQWYGGWRDHLGFARVQMEAAV